MHRPKRNRKKKKRKNNREGHLRKKTDMTEERFSIIDYPSPANGQTIKILYDVKAGPDYRVKRWRYNSVDFIAVLTKSGQGMLRTKEQTFVLKKGDFLVVGADQLQTYSVEGDVWHFLWFEFESDILPMEPNVCYSIPQKYWREAECEECLQYMKKNRGEVASAVFAALMYKWADTVNAIERDENFTLVQRSISYIRSNLLDITVSGIAEKFYLSERTLRNTYVRYLGMSPSQVILRIRMKEAKNLLEQSGMSVAKIAERLGYRNAIYFGKTFSKHIGISPTQYRNRANSFRAGVNVPEAVAFEKFTEL